MLEEQAEIKIVSGRINKAFILSILKRQNRKIDLDSGRCQKLNPPGLAQETASHAWKHSLALFVSPVGGGRDEVEVIAQVLWHLSWPLRTYRSEPHLCYG